MKKTKKPKEKKGLVKKERQIYLTVLKESILGSLEDTVCRFMEMAGFHTKQYRIIPKTETKLYAEKSNRVKKDIGVDMFNTVMSLREPVIIEGYTDSDFEKLVFVFLELKFSDRLESLQVLLQKHLRDWENAKAQQGQPGSQGK